MADIRDAGCADISRYHGWCQGRFSFVAGNSDIEIIHSSISSSPPLLHPYPPPSAQRFAPARSVARRFNHSDSKLPSWVVDNEFNRERAAVKHHAAATSGPSSSFWPQLVFNRP